jgi:AbrB family looped-hinge helix DNA binding protein
MQSALHGAQRAADERRDLVERGTGEKPQFHHHAMFGGQGGHGGLHEPRFFRTFGGDRRRGVAAGAVGGLILSACHGPQLPPRLQEPVPENAVEPGRKPTAFVESSERPPGLDQRFLGEVLGFVVVAAESPCAPPERLGVSCDEFTKRSHVAAARAADQFGFIRNGFGHDDKYSHRRGKRFTACSGRGHRLQFGCTTYRSILSIDQGASMHHVTISPKFQVVIPRVVRERLGLRPGQKLQVIEHAGRVEFVPERNIRELKAFVKGIKTDFVRDGDRL